MTTFPPCDKPTFYFVGVTTAQSSALRIFPQWMKILGLDAVIVGYDAPLHAPAETYRAIVEHIKNDPLARGALVTTHKIDLLNACHDLFDELDPYARLCGEVSSISKQDGRLIGQAVDPISSGLAWQAFVEPGHWRRTGGEVLCLGSGGAAGGISVYAAGLTDDHPARFTLVDIRQERLDHAGQIHSQIQSQFPFEYVLNGDIAENDRRLAALPPGSMVINATGMGKDRPGSPISDDAIFPENCLAWELNYRGQLEFWHQAWRQAEQRRLAGHHRLVVEDGWVYFVHGWSQVVARVFHFEVTPKLFTQLDEAARAYR
jgi:shikimate 5-dehydrogenase